MTVKRNGHAAVKNAGRRARLRVFLVDNCPALREGLSYILQKETDFSVCGEAADAHTALGQIIKLKPDLVISEIALEESSGIDLVKELRNAHFKRPVLIFSLYKESLYADRALRAGANGYVMKRESTAALLSAIQQLLQGHIYLSKIASDLLLQKVVAGASTDISLVDHLSDREFEVFRRIGRGYGNRQIADELHLSIKTVETHREHIRHKLNVENNFKLVQQAIDWVRDEAAHG